MSASVSSVIFVLYTDGFWIGFVARRAEVAGRCLNSWWGLLLPIENIFFLSSSAGITVGDIQRSCTGVSDSRVDQR